MCSAANPILQRRRTNIIPVPLAGRRTPIGSGSVFIIAPAAKQLIFVMSFGSRRRCQNQICSFSYHQVVYVEGGGEEERLSYQITSLKVSIWGGESFLSNYPNVLRGSCTTYVVYVHDRWWKAIHTHTHTHTQHLLSHIMLASKHLLFSPCMIDYNGGSKRLSYLK